MRSAEGLSTDLDEVVSNVAGIVDSSLHAAEAYESVTEELRRVVPIDRLVIWILDRFRDTATSLFVSGVDIPGREVGTTMRGEGAIGYEEVRRRELFHIGDTRSRGDGCVKAARAAGLRANVVAPLISNDSVVGILTLWSRSANAFEEHHLELIGRVASELTRRVAPALAQEQAHLAALENEALIEISRVVTSSLDLDEIYDRFAEHVRKIIDFDLISVVLADSREGTLTRTYTSPAGETGVPLGWTGPLNGSVTQEVVNTASPLIIELTSAHELAKRFPALLPLFRDGFRSQISVPLMSRGLPFGALHLSSRRARPYSQRHLDLLSRIGAQMAGAVANSRLYAASEEGEREQRRLAHQNGVMAEIGRIIGASLNIDEVYERFVERLRELLPFDRVSITIIDAQCGTVGYAYVDGEAIPGWEAGKEVPSGSVAEDEVRSGKAFVVRADNEEQLIGRLPSERLAYDAGFRSLLSVPLIHRDALIGYLHLRSKNTDAYTDRDLPLAEQVGTQIAGAVASSQLYYRLEKESTEREVLAELGRIVSSSLDIGVVYEQLTGLVAELIPFDRTTIITIDLEGGIVATAYQWGIDVPGSRRGAVTPLPGTQAEKVIGMRLAALIQTEDRDELATRFPGLLPDFDAGIRSFLAVPLISRGLEIVMLQLQSTKPDAYGEADVILAERVASQIAGAVANSQLYAERTQAERALRESEARMRAVVDSAADAIITYDEHGIADSFNPAAERIFGYAANEVIGRNVHMLMPDSPADEHEAQVANHLSAGQAHSVGIGEVLAQRQDGSAFPADIAVSEYFVGERRMFVSIMRDITERKQLEEQFLQAQKMQAVGQLAGGVAHDFNNMLTAITNYTYLATKGLPQESAVSDYLREVQSAAERAGRLTSQLLAFSRHQVIEPTVLNPNKIIMETDKMLRRLIGEDIELVTLGDPELGLVRVDPGQIEQVLTNLALNARDAMPEGGKLVIEATNVSLDEEFARWHPETAAGEYILLSVSDTGVGMTEEVRTHAFEPFFTTKEVGKGTGLGLSTCYGIVAQSGGHIEVQSEPGQGATFRIYLPRVDETSDTLPPRDESGYLPTGSETILLVEDEPLVQQVTAEILRAQGYDVLEAANGTEAMQVATEHAGEPIHLLLTDVVMPLMGGTQLAQQFTKVRPETRVLYMSGYVDDTMVHQQVVQNYGVFLQKPFTAQMLARRVREILDRDPTGD